MSAKPMSPTQRKALEIAAPSGGMRRLTGGYWVASDSTVRPGFGAPPDGDRWVGTTTIAACCNRGWMAWGKSGLVATITDAGRTIATEAKP